MWVTEFNLADLTKGHVFQGTWLHGLFVAAQALLFSSDPDITYAGLNDTVGTAASAPIFDGSQGFGSGGPKTVPLGPRGTTLATIQAAGPRVLGAAAGLLRTAARLDRSACGARRLATCRAEPCW